MDIKDFILIAGGLLIAAVVAHGFWIAWRARSEPLRLDIVPDLVAEDGDDLTRFKGELPNGGARVIGQPGDPSPEQGDLLDGMDVPVLLEPNVAPEQAHARQEAERELLGQAAADRKISAQPVRSSDLAPEPVADDLFTPRVDPVPQDTGLRRPTSVAENASVAADVSVAEARGVAEDGAIVKDGAVAKDGAVSDGVPTPEAATDTPAADVVLPEHPIVVTPPERAASANDANRRPLRPERPVERKPTLPKREPRRLANRGTPTPGLGDNKAANDTLDVSDAAAPAVDELIILHLLAREGTTFEGTVLVDALRARGLKFGAMNIFHRSDPMTRNRRYSVANAMEPGVFDLSDLDNLRSKGLTFFLQLPGPEEPLAALEDMIDVARGLATQLGGEVRDEQRSLLTGQTVAHLRQRVSDHARKLLSKRA